MRQMLPQPGQLDLPGLFLSPQFSMSVSSGVNRWKAGVESALVSTIQEFTYVSHIVGRLFFRSRNIKILNGKIVSVSFEYGGKGYEIGINYDFLSKPGRFDYRAGVESEPVPNTITISYLRFRKINGINNGHLKAFLEKVIKFFQSSLA
ncbi:MAG: hypothetical protein PHE25_00050 [Candidatus Gracilibacteria bacterium]|nr:hypothetical protein [Candidatus Gracilibacteria bacterium]